jgi:hypothetical protein
MSTRSRKIMFLGSRAWPVRTVTALQRSVSRLFRKCGILNISQPCRSPLSVARIYLLVYFALFRVLHPCITQLYIGLLSRCQFVSDAILLKSKRFRLCCMPLRIAGFVGLSVVRNSKYQKTHRLGNWICFSSSGEEKETDDWSSDWGYLFPIFMKLGMYTMAPEAVSTAYFINPSHQSVWCVFSDSC